MKIFLLIFLNTFCLVGISQTITIDSTKSNYHPSNLDEFYYIHPNFDSTAYMWVADITCHFDTLDYDCNLRKAYRMLELESNKLGGNGFIVTDSDIFSIENKYISLSIYKLRNGTGWHKKNYFLFPNNKAYLIGDLFYQNPDYILNIKVNGTPLILDRFSYVELDLPKGANINIEVNYKRKKSDILINHNSEKVKDKDLVVYFQIKPFLKKEFSQNLLEWTYGQFLIQILKEQTF